MAKRELTSHTDVPPTMGKAGPTPPAKGIHSGSSGTKGSGSIFHPAHAMEQYSGGSAPQNTAVGSGSRPTRSMHEIPTSAPENPHQLDRDPPPFLGGGGDGRKVDQ